MKTARRATGNLQSVSSRKRSFSTAGKQNDSLFILVDIFLFYSVFYSWKQQNRWTRVCYRPPCSVTKTKRELKKTKTAITSKLKVFVVKQDVHFYIVNQCFCPAGGVAHQPAELWSFSITPLTHPVRTGVPVPRGQGLQGPTVVVRPQPGGLPSGHSGTVLPSWPTACRTIGLLGAQPIGPQVTVHHQLIFGVLNDGWGSGCGGVLLRGAVELLVGIQFWVLDRRIDDFYRKNSYSVWRKKKINGRRVIIVREVLKTKRIRNKSRWGESKNIMRWRENS